jgi:hypothetical protein
MVKFADSVNIKGLTYIDSSLYFLDSSVMIYRDASGALYFDDEFNHNVSLTDLLASTGVTKAYIDGSLNLRLLEASIGSGFTWNNGLLDVSSQGDVTKAYVDASLLQRDTIIGNADYASNLFINDGDNHSTSLSNLDQIMGLIAPGKPNLLTSQTLALTNSTKYSAKLPSGLATSWYTDVPAGSTVTDYVVDTTYRLTTPGYTLDPPTFRAGIYQDGSAAGTLTAVVNGVDLVTYNMNLGVGNVSIGNSDASGYLRCNSTGGYGGSGSNFWRKGEAFIDITSQKEGLVTYAIKHSEALQSNTVSMRYDNINSAPVFTRSASSNDLVPVNVYLSGINHYGSGSTFTVSASVGSGIFYKSYHPTNVAVITSSGGSNLNINPGSTPDASDAFLINSTFTFNSTTYSSGSSNGTITITAYKPNGITGTSTATLPRRIDTYPSNRATTTVEYFTDETRRIKDGSSGTDLVWSSSDYALFNPGNGAYAQVRNGSLQYPVSADYGGFAFSGTDKMYKRRFTKASASAGSLTFVGFAPNSQLGAYGSGDVNILIWLTDQGLFFDLGSQFGIGGGSGLTMATAISAYTSLSGTAINWSLGTNSTGNEVAHNGTYVVIVIFRNTTRSMTQITAA